MLNRAGGRLPVRIAEGQAKRRMARWRAECRIQRISNNQDDGFIAMNPSSFVCRMLVGLRVYPVH